jgi:membrane complex biogenesis BtpA family protein
MTGAAKVRLVGVIHLPPLPGSPRAGRPMAEIAAACAEDARVLVGAGYDLAMLENFGDAPFFRGRVPAITVSAMTACASAARQACPNLALGINVLRNDADAALAIAHVVGASVIRVNVHVGARVTDQGVVEGEAASTLRTRAALGASCGIWADVDVKHSAALAGQARAPADEAKDIVARGLADAVLVTGEGTGRPVDAKKLAAVRAAVAGVPLLVASGATEEQLAALAEHADGVIVGSALRANGVAGGPIDPKRAGAFAKAFREAFA